MPTAYVIYTSWDSVYLNFSVFMGVSIPLFKRCGFGISEYEEPLTHNILTA